MALRSECPSAQMSKIKNGRLDLDGIDHFYKCNHLMLLQFKELKPTVHIYLSRSLSPGILGSLTADLWCPLLYLLGNTVFLSMCVHALSVFFSLVALALASGQFLLFVLHHRTCDFFAALGISTISSHCTYPWIDGQVELTSCVG